VSDPSQDRAIFPPGFLLVRIDDRLLHGQVVLGWGGRLSPRGYLIVDDEVARDAWEREAFRAAAPPEAPVAVLSVAAFVREASAIREPDRTVVLLRGLHSLLPLIAAGFRPAGGVNLGGLHAGTRTRELLPYLHMTDEDRRVLDGLLEDGYPLYAQDLPTSARHGPEKLSARLRG
jgi:mannose/fructose/N-acetylgalactosamine-specific phosphotransferase system component IIB